MAHITNRVIIKKKNQLILFRSNLKKTLLIILFNLVFTITYITICQYHIFSFV